MLVSGIIIGSLSQNKSTPSFKELIAKYTSAALDHFIISFLQKVQLLTQNIIINVYLRNWLKPSVGKSSDAWKIVCSRRWASPVVGFVRLLFLLLLNSPVVSFVRMLLLLLLSTRWASPVVGFVPKGCCCYCY